MCTVAANVRSVAVKMSSVAVKVWRVMRCITVPGEAAKAEEEAMVKGMAKVM